MLVNWLRLAAALPRVRLHVTDVTRFPWRPLSKLPNSISTSSLALPPVCVKLPPCAIVHNLYLRNQNARVSSRAVHVHKHLVLPK